MTNANYGVKALDLANWQGAKWEEVVEGRVNVEDVSPADANDTLLQTTIEVCYTFQPKSDGVGWRNPMLASNASITATLTTTSSIEPPPEGSSPPPRLEMFLERKNVVDNRERFSVKAPITETNPEVNSSLQSWYAAVQNQPKLMELAVPNSQKDIMVNHRQTIDEETINALGSRDGSETNVIDNTTLITRACQLLKDKTQTAQTG